MRIAKIAAAAVAAMVAAYATLVLFVRPSNSRNWSPDQAVLASADVRGPLVTVHNIRNFRYATEERWTPGYYDRTFDLRGLNSMWFVVEPFGKQKAAAHTFVSFGFANGDFLSISVEIRKEAGETFSPLKGLFRRYEIMYVIGDERDLVRLRSDYRRDPVLLYRVNASPDAMRTMFVDMLQRANELRERPEFYNTLTNTCTTTLVHHVNRMIPDRIPLRAGVLLPGYSDRLAYELGLIDNSIPFEELRRKSRINERSASCSDNGYSRCIRAGL
jgi:hypothetical protein